eukprot:5869373-Ditylum_brightwellii.AAC.1
MTGYINSVKEDTLLQQRACQLGEHLGVSVVVDRTHKRHPERAGEAIEYIWANQQIFLCLVLIGKRKTVE